jgi:DDE superfamily endonuclease
MVLAMAATGNAGIPRAGSFANYGVSAISIRAMNGWQNSFRRNCSLSITRRPPRGTPILDNLNTHKPKNDRWLNRHPNVHFHFTPTRASWLNQVEIWFSILEGKSLHGASFASVNQLREHIDAFIESYNQNAKPFLWTKAQVHQRRVKGRRISEL